MARSLVVARRVVRFFWGYALRAAQVEWQRSHSLESSMGLMSRKLSLSAGFPATAGFSRLFLKSALYGILLRSNHQ